MILPKSRLGAVLLSPTSPPFTLHPPDTPPHLSLVLINDRPAAIGPLQLLTLFRPHDHVTTSKSEEIRSGKGECVAGVGGRTADRTRCGDGGCGELGWSGVKEWEK